MISVANSNMDQLREVRLIRTGVDVQNNEQRSKADAVVDAVETEIRLIDLE